MNATRPRILLDADREAWYAEQMAKCEEAQKKSADELGKWWKDADGSWHKSGATQWEITSKGEASHE